MPELMPLKAAPTQKRLTDGSIRAAIHTVRVRSTDKGWTVKKVAHHGVRTFGTRQEAMNLARKLAEQSSWAIVVHGKSGKITQTFPPPAKSKSASAKTTLKSGTQDSFPMKGKR